MLQTERLLLRRPEAADAPAFEEAVGDAEVMQYIGDGLPHGPEHAARWMEIDRQRWEADGFGRFVVLRRDSGAVVGRIGLSVWDPEDWAQTTRAETGERAEIELGWTLVRPAWGNGYATEAAAAVRDWALHELGFERLISLIQAENVQSKRVAERLGESYERNIVTATGFPAELWSLNRSGNANAAPLRSWP